LNKQVFFIPLTHHPWCVGPQWQELRVYARQVPTHHNNILPTQNNSILTHFRPHPWISR
jgi:hypothetical protein